MNHSAYRLACSLAPLNVSAALLIRSLRKNQFDLFYFMSHAVISNIIFVASLTVIVLSDNLVFLNSPSHKWQNMCQLFKKMEKFQCTNVYKSMISVRWIIIFVRVMLWQNIWKLQRNMMNALRRYLYFGNNISMLMAYTFSFPALNHIIRSSDEIIVIRMHLFWSSFN